jgi:general secretion pathway protein I
LIDVRVRRQHAIARRGRVARGFSMLEVLVAFVILALVGTALFRLFSGALGNAAAAEDYSRAVLVAETALAEAAGTPPLREGTKSGSVDDGRIEWTASIAPYVAPQANPDPNAPADVLPVQLYRVRADVTFTSGSGKPRTISLATLRLGSKESLP